MEPPKIEEKISLFNLQRHTTAMKQFLSWQVCQNLKKMHIGRLAQRIRGKICVLFSTVWMAGWHVFFNTQIHTHAFDSSNNQLNGCLLTSKLNPFYLLPCLLDDSELGEWIVNNPRKDPGALAARCLTFWMSSAWVAATFLSMMDALYGFVSQPPRFQAWQGPETWRDWLTYTGGSFPWIVTACHRAVRCDRGGHSTATVTGTHREKKTACFLSCFWRGMLG